MVPVIAKVPADDNVRDKWLERLWAAVQEDDIPYLETLSDYGEISACHCSVPRDGRTNLSTPCEWHGAPIQSFAAISKAQRPA